MVVWRRLTISVIIQNFLPATVWYAERSLEPTEGGLVCIHDPLWKWFPNPQC